MAMRRFWQYLAFADRLYIGYFFFYLALFSIFRILFFIIYSYRITNFEVGTILLTFLIGIRFDISTIGMILGIGYPLSQINFLNRLFFYRLTWSIYPVVLVSWCNIHLISDLIYYENANKHIGYEAIIYLADFPILISSAFLANPYKITLIATLLLLIFFFSIKIYFKKLIPKGFEHRGFFLQILILVITSSFILICIRGGIQQTPLRSSNAIVGGDTLVNNIALNGVYTTIMDLKSQTIPEFLKMSLKESVPIVREEIKYEGADFMNDPDYPILRIQHQTNSGDVPNIVLIFQESWTGKFVWPISNGHVHGKELTPFYNQMAQKGHSFKNFYANGGRTSNGLFSVLTGIPDRPGLTVVRTHQVLSNFSGLGQIFKKWGYDTTFITGDDLKFDSLNTILPHWGFRELIGKKEISEKRKYRIGAWGYDDEDIFSVLFDKMNESYGKGKPFLATALTMTTHYPYKVPHPKFEIFDSSLPDFDYLNTYHYSDWALADFIKKVETAPYYKNTIFVLVGDHTHHRYLSYYEDRNVPFLIYAPAIIKPKLDEAIASQLDVLPTIIGLVGKETYFSAMGRNLRAPNLERGRAYFAYSAAFGWIEENQFVYHWVDGDKQGYLTAKPPYVENADCKITPTVCSSSILKGRAFFNLSIDLMNQNKVFPGEK